MSGSSHSSMSSQLLETRWRRWPGGHSQENDPTELTQRPPSHRPGTAAHSSISYDTHIIAYTATKCVGSLISVWDLALLGGEVAQVSGGAVEVRAALAGVSPGHADCGAAELLGAHDALQRARAQRAARLRVARTLAHTIHHIKVVHIENLVVRLPVFVKKRVSTIVRPAGVRGLTRAAVDLAARAGEAVEADAAVRRDAAPAVQTRLLADRCNATQNTYILMFAVYRNVIFHPEPHILACLHSCFIHLESKHYFKSYKFT